MIVATDPSDIIYKLSTIIFFFSLPQNFFFFLQRLNIMRNGI